MKKLIIVLSIFAMFVAMGIAEIIYTTKVFKEVQSGLNEISVCFEKYPDHFDNDETIEKIAEITDKWNKNRTLLFIVGNHNVMRNADEKLISLKRQIETNVTQDAEVTLTVLLNYVSDLIEDTHPKVINLF